MRAFLLLIAGFGLAACASSQPNTLSNLAGPGNLAAMDASVDCRNDDALTFARGAAQSETVSHRLFAQFAQAAIYTDMGNSSAAAKAIDTATNDPTLNPDGLSREQMQQSADAVLAGIRGRREEAIGSPSC